MLNGFLTSLPKLKNADIDKQVATVLRLVNSSQLNIDELKVILQMLRDGQTCNIYRAVKLVGGPLLEKAGKRVVEHEQGKLDKMNLDCLR
jgi:hypothetical protein